MNLQETKLIALLIAALAIAAIPVSDVRAQTPPVKGNTQDSSAPTAFSIETEMLTYRALESNTEAIACDIAAYLNKAEVVKFNSTVVPGPSLGESPPPPVCDVNAGRYKATVIILPFDSSEFRDFQIWRADMATMTRLHKKAQDDCPSAAPNTGKPDGETKSGTKAAPATAASAAGTLLSTSPAGPPLAIAQSVLALMASQESTSSVGGTIQDQAFMNGVARELEELSVPVLMPSAYTPYSLTALDKYSPFLISLQLILNDRGVCMERFAASDDTKSKGNTSSKDDKQMISDNKENRNQRMVDDIDAFLGTLTEGAILAPQGTKAQSTKQENVNASTQNPAETQKSAATTPQPSSSHLSAVLLADGLAEKLGMRVDKDKGDISFPEETSSHVLLVKALESGGSVSRFSNIFGTTIRYSGGSVGTYALFSMDGSLECSGNVFEYGGFIQAKDFADEYRKRADPAKQAVFLRHGCRRPTQTQ